MMKLDGKITVFSLVAALLLGGCVVAGETDRLVCPSAALLRDADKIVFFKEGAATEVAANAAIAGFAGGCEAAKDGGIIYSLALDFAAERAAGETGKSLELPYFIAVLSPDEEILQRVRFITTIDFDNEGRGVSSEEHELKIPLSDLSTGGHYEITAGFALTPEQLEANRSKKE